MVGRVDHDRGVAEQPSQERHVRLHPPGEGRRLRGVRSILRGRRRERQY